MIEKAKEYAQVGTGYFRKYGIRTIAFTQGTIAAIAGITGLIPDKHLKYYLGASALLNYWHGFLKHGDDDS